MRPVEDRRADYTVSFSYLGNQGFVFTGQPGTYILTIQNCSQLVLVRNFDIFSEIDIPGDNAKL